MPAGERPDMSLADDVRIRIPDGVVFREVKGEAVLLELETGRYYGLDEVGTRIWQLLVSTRSLRSTLASLIAEPRIP